MVFLPSLGRLHELMVYSETYYTEQGSELIEIYWLKLMVWVRLEHTSGRRQHSSQLSHELPKLKCIEVLYERTKL